MKRRLKAGMVGGGRDAFIGGVHRMAMRLDGRIELVRSLRTLRSRNFPDPKRVEGFEPDEIAMNLPDEILAALEFSALDPKAFCRIDEVAYRTEGRSGHGRA
jgi:hypothetical protein